MDSKALLILVGIFFIGAHGESLGEKTISKDGARVKELLENHIHRLITKSDGKLQLKEMLSATTQVVAGLSHVVKGTFLQGSNELSCEVTMWERSWMAGDDALIISAKCENGVSYQ